jgi:hypothetical protein
MPTVIVPTEGEAVGTSGAAKIQGLTAENARVVSNIALADHMGKFVAGQILEQFGQENIAEMINKKDMVAVTIKWG